VKLAAALFSAASLGAPIVVAAQDVFPDVEYIQGKGQFTEKIKGQLLVNDSGVTFSKKDGSAVFTIPMAEIKDATNSLQTDPGSVGRKLVLGVFSSKREEFVYVNTETPQRAEVVVFKCHKKNTSPEMMAKIKFHMGKAKPQPADSLKH